MNLTYDLIARKIDHALLLPTLTEAETIAGCQLAANYAVASVCVKPTFLRQAAQVLRGSAVEIGTVVGFPHGGQATPIKLAETVEALNDGATEIDMVINIGNALGGRWDQVRSEIESITRVVHDRERLIKIIFENCYLRDLDKIQLCEICNVAGVDYVKTSTGFGNGGATIPDLVLMKSHIRTNVKLKASGGIRDLQTASNFVELGAERLGTSQTTRILDELCEILDLPQRQVSRETIADTSDRGSY